MTFEVFTEPWAKAWADQIRASDIYRSSAATWEGSVALELAGDSPQAVYLDLWRGECREARVATAEDLDQADYILSAELEVWKRILASQLEPILGLMSGKIKLRRGSLAGLTPYMQASRELVAAAARVDSRFPDAD